MKGRKRLISIFASVLFLCGALSFAGCDGNTDEIKNLQEQVTAQTEMLQKLEAKLSEQTEQLEKLKEEITDGQTENKSLLEKLNALEKDRENLLNELALSEVRGHQRKGEFVRLGDAYDQKILTREDMKYISYYLKGEVYEAKEGTDWRDESNWEKLDFVPLKPLKNLDVFTEKDIKVVSYIDAMEIDHNDYYSVENYLDTDIRFEFYGEYRGNYVVSVYGLYDAGAMVDLHNYDGICFTSSGHPILVFQYKNK